MQWRYYSKKSSEQGFKPASPLHFETERVWAHAASLVVKTYVMQEINIDAVKEALERIHNAKKKSTKQRRWKQPIMPYLTSIEANEHLQQVFLIKAKQEIQRS